ncbi:CdaR family transcriptional regulator [Streptomyces sp. 840.1]|uniref:PucR family transcriptional regulator n=1 Tax=Streptomyces sp. 840.1 TaxID=2485152 RepID=UPI000F49FECA|nr:helix-turn-helix domain-containing protein [Streptomyces sp. 840.1]
MRGRGEDRGWALLDALLDDRSAPGLAALAAEVLGLAECGRYAVAVLSLRGCPGPGPRAPVAHGLRFLWRVRPDRVLGVVALGEAEPASVAALLADRCRGPGGVSPAVRGLAGLGTARRLADAALLTCGTGRGDVACLDGRVPAALVAGLPPVSAYLAAEVFGALLARGPAERALLLSTLDAWLECGGSAGRAAGRLRCHRNTVLNRLRRLEALTSRSLSRPRELVEVVLALDALRLLPAAAL